MSDISIDFTSTNHLSALTTLHDSTWKTDPIHEMYLCRLSRFAQLSIDMITLIRKNIKVDDNDFKKITAEFEYI